MMRATVCATMMLMAAGSAHAEQFNLDAGASLFAGAWSTHLITEDYTNETHNLVGVEYKGFVAGYFENSYGRDTVFVGKFMETNLTENISGFVIVGAMHGYTRCVGEDGSSKNLCLMASVGASYTRYKVQPTVFMLGDAVAGGFRYQF